MKADHVEELKAILGMQPEAGEPVVRWFEKKLKKPTKKQREEIAKWRCRWEGSKLITWREP